MQYPLDKSEFIRWVKCQPPDKLLDLKLELLASETDLGIQFSNYITSNHQDKADWSKRANVKLRQTQWRLQVVNLLSEQGAQAFQRAAYHLLDKDTYETILEAASNVSTIRVN